MAAFRGPRWFARLRRNGAALAGLILLALLTLSVVAGPWVTPYEESSIEVEKGFERPSRDHWFGRDQLGRDLLTRVFFGGRVSMSVGAMGALLSLLIGVSVGGFAAMAGGRIESFIMRAIDFLYAVPLLLVVISLMVMFGPGLSNVFIALGLVYWLRMARVTRARVAELKSQEFVQAARSLGAGPLRIFARHVLPNASGVIVVTATFMVPEAIFAESFLSFLGLGVTLPHASWGTLAADGLEAMRSYPHVLMFPSIAICLTMLAFQAFGEGLRQALDPREAELD